MTIKYLITLPTYCKHKAPLSQAKSGCVSGTFLLSNHGLHGSAIRSLGAHQLGDGLCGEIDMRLHWVHDSELPNLPRTRKAAIAHLNENKAETLMRMGNVRELRDILRRLPIRIRSRTVVLQDVEVSIKDIFSGLNGHVESKSKKEASLRHIMTPQEVDEHVQLADQKLDVVKVKEIELSSVSDMDCGGFLESLLIDQLIPALVRQVVVGSIGYQALGTILGGASVASKKWFTDLGMDMASISKSAVRSAMPLKRGNAAAKPEPPLIQRERSNSTIFNDASIRSQSPS
jgi:hypothetical protein